MGHVVTFNVEVGDKDFQEIKGKIPNKLYDTLETRRELQIMREVMSHEGDNILQKIDSTIEDWGTGNGKKINNKRYKLKHRILWQSLSKC
jgi:hypothetical protein